MPSPEEKDHALQVIEEDCPELVVNSAYYVDPTMQLTDDTQSEVIKFIVALSIQSRKPLLIWLVDAYHRCIIERQHDPEVTVDNDWFQDYLRRITQHSQSLRLIYDRYLRGGIVPRELTRRIFSKWDNVITAIEPFQYDDDIGCYRDIVRGLRQTISSVLEYSYCALPCQVDTIVIPRNVSPRIHTECNRNGIDMDDDDDDGDDNDDGDRNDDDDDFKDPERSLLSDDSVDILSPRQQLTEGYLLKNCMEQPLRAAVPRVLERQISHFLDGHYGAQSKQFGDVGAKLRDHDIVGDAVHYKSIDTAPSSPVHAPKIVSEFLTEAVQKFHLEHRPGHRVLLVVDRRGCNVGDGVRGHVGTKLYAYLLPSDRVRESRRESYVRCSFFFRSKKCVIPGFVDDPLGEIGLFESLQGQMFGLSHHVYAEDDVACYWSRHGSAHRFFVEDMYTVWPSFFVEVPDSFRDDAMERAHDMAVNGERDARFTRFYRHCRHRSR